MLGAVVDRVASCFSVCRIAFLICASSKSRVMVLCMMMSLRCCMKASWKFFWKVDLFVCVCACVCACAN